MDFKALREQLTDEMLKNILAEFDVTPVYENENEIVFPTCCHNLIGGSPKLFYYKNTRLFHCYTECNSSFDIFTLLQKMYKLRGTDITLYQAIELCGLTTEGTDFSSKTENCDADIRYMQTLNNTYIPDIEKLEFKKYDKNILRQYTFDYIGLMPWIQEGIDIPALQKFNIKYDKNNNCIIIPNFDYNGNLIGLRGRFLNPKDVLKGKYRPIYKDNILYNHPTGKTFYGIFENHKAIEKKHMVIIFEGEKSVLLYNTLYGSENNISLATLGQNITKDHIQYLIKMGVSDIILAYDTDYEDYKQLAEVEEKYIEKAKILSPYFNVSILMDYDFLLPYKSSPIDGGKEIFEKLLQERRIV